MKILKPLLFFCCLALFILPQFHCLSPGVEEIPEIPVPSGPEGRRDIPVPGRRWRGFNLQGMYILEGSNYGFKEEQFRMIHELGFNYVRLPLDYRTYTSRGDWYDFTAEPLARLDEAINWARVYGLHVELNLHRAPGFCIHDQGAVASWVSMPENQQLDLWSDREAQEAFFSHWEFFARRYREIPNEYLSFNLLNEPNAVSPQVYTEVMAGAIRRIRAVSPERWITLDGLGAGADFVPELLDLDLDLFLSIHSYEPGNITHYKAEWVEGADRFPPPQWPPPYFLGQYLYGHYKAESGLNTPLTITGKFPAGTTVALNVMQVSAETVLQLRTEREVLLEHRFIQGDGEGEWEKVIYQPQWNIYQNIYNKRYSSYLGQEAGKLFFHLPEGDWLIFSQITIDTQPRIKGGELIFKPTFDDWGVPQASYSLTVEGGLKLTNIPAGYESYYRIDDRLLLWRQAAEQQGAHVMVGEFGVYNKTPHEVTLALLEYKLKAFQEAGFGWALWEFSGAFGIFNSGRADVEYEEYNGYSLDRKMLDLLQRY